jgi:hypothetical protein
MGTKLLALASIQILSLPEHRISRFLRGILDLKIAQTVGE